LSYHADAIFHAQAMNMASALDGRLQYEYYLHALSKRSRFAKWIKVENPEHLDIVKKFYKFSNKKARRALEILTEEDIQYIKDRQFEGGLTRKKK
jgi:hypothetical protein